ncbi:MAG TPA: MFS transporter [Desulfobacterales bacterium]
MNPSRGLATLRRQYFLYFGILGIYLPYFNLYCYHIGFNGAEIGSLSAVRSTVMVIFSLAWGHLADRHRIRKPIYTLCSFAAAGLWLLYFTTAEFWPMVIITVLYTAFFAPLISFLEAFTMDTLQSRKAAYGKVRVWGSIGFITVVILMGRLIDHFPIRLILVLIFCGSLLQALSSLRVPRLDTERRFSSETRSFLQPRIIVFLTCGFLMLVSHGAYYGFFSIHLENLGYSRTFIGFSWALASAAEILVMIRSEALFRKFSLERVLLFSFAVAALRWLLLYSFSQAAAILLIQTLHAATYGLFHMASILYIDRQSPDRAKTLGQAINNSVQYGFGLMVGFFMSGFLYERIGSAALFLVSGAIALATGLLFGAYVKTSRGANPHGDKPEIG